MSGGGTGLISGGGLSMGSGGRGTVGFEGCSIMPSKACKTLACEGRHMGRPLRDAQASTATCRGGPACPPLNVQSDRSHQRQRIAVLDDAGTQVVVEGHAPVLETILEVQVHRGAANRGRELGEREIVRRD